MSIIRLGHIVSVKGTKIVGTLNGKGFSQEDGAVVERYILKIDTSKITLQDIVPFLHEIVINPNRIIR